MTRSHTPSVAALPGAGRWLRAATAAIALAIWALAGHAAPAPEAKTVTLTKEDQACLDCHAKPALDKTLDSGETLSLHISAKNFAESVHGETGCEGCHNEIDLKDHGKDSPKPIASKRAQSLAMMDTCRDCHKKIVKQYDDSVHSAMVRHGSADAPLCTDCHNPHATRSAKGAEPARAEPCVKCHEAITTAFTDSVHGPAGDEALRCSDCHRTHNVKAASLGDHLKGQCISCHRDTVTTHAAWLPNAERHLDAISCPACHAPDAKRRVNLRLYDGAARTQAAEKVGVPQFVSFTTRADAADAGLDARALWSLLQDFNRSGPQSKTVLRGRLEVQSGVDAHRLAKKTHAVKACDTCHRQGAEPFQSVTVTMAGPDGRPLRHAARQGVLSSVESIESVGGFYAIGGTRIKLLDSLLVMAVAAGIGIPAAHLAMKLWMKRTRARQAGTAGEAAAPERDANGRTLD